MEKKIFVVVAVLLLVAPIVSAQEQVDPGVTPDSPLYGLDVAMERMRMAMTRGDENKINYGLQIAEERIAEIRAVSNNTEAVQKAETNRQRIMNRVQQRAQNASEQVRQRIRQRLQRHQEELEQVRERVPQQARQGIDTAIENVRRQRGRPGY